MGSSSILGRSPTGRVWTIVFRLIVDGEYTGRSVENQPKYGASDSRPGVSHSSPARAKLASLSETHTPQEKTSSRPMIGISTRPQTKEPSPLITHWSEERKFPGPGSSPGCQ